METVCFLPLLFPTSAILEPDFDLLGLDVAEDGALSDQLLPPQRAGLGALVVDPLQRLHLLGGVPHVLARVHLLARALPVHRQRHPQSRVPLCRFFLRTFSRGGRKKKEECQCLRGGQSGRLSPEAGSLCRREPPISFMRIMSRSKRALSGRTSSATNRAFLVPVEEERGNEEDGPCAGLLSPDANLENFPLLSVESD